MSTPPIPQTTVSQSGMLSRSPGAKNLPSRPMMMPAMITPMMSTGDPFHLLGTAWFHGVREYPSGRGLKPAREHCMTEVADHSLTTCRDPTSQPGTARLIQLGSSGRLAVTWRSRLASCEPASALVHLHRMRSVNTPAVDRDLHGWLACCW